MTNPTFVSSNFDRICKAPFCKEIGTICDFTEKALNYIENNQVSNGLVTLHKYCYYGLCSLTIVLCFLYLWLRVLPLKHK